MAAAATGAATISGTAQADARVEEDDSAVLSLALTLSRTAGGTVSVDFATSDESAQAGANYTAESGTLTFAAGQSSKTSEVSVLDDAHDEGEETLTLTLSNASGGRISDSEATGTIKNRDPLPRALLARFRANGRCARGRARSRSGCRRPGSRASGGGSLAGSRGGAWSAICRSTS